MNLASLDHLIFKDGHFLKKIKLRFINFNWARFYVNQPTDELRYNKLLINHVASVAVTFPRLLFPKSQNA